MKVFIAVLALASFAYAENAQELPSTGNTAYGYLKNIGIPLGEKIRAAEDAILSKQRIVGGLPAALGQYPYQAGLLSSMIGIQGTGVCGGSLLTTSRVLTAAHCWFDGVHQAWKFEVVLGSVMLFSGGQRIDTSVIAMHPNWTPILARNDVAVIYLPSPVTLSNNVNIIGLPTSAELNNDWVGNTAIASGYGMTGDGDDDNITLDQTLNQMRLVVIANGICTLAYPIAFHSTNICTSGIGGIGICRGDSGGPLVTQSEGRDVLIGISSFVSTQGCAAGYPSAYARVTSFIPFINQHV